VTRPVRSLAASTAERLARPLDKGAVARGALVLVVLVLALDLRLTALELTEVYNPIRADAEHYAAYTRNLVESGTYSRTIAAHGTPPAADFLRPPGFPLFATLFYDADVAAFIEQVTTAQALLNTLSVLALFFVGYALLGYWPALLATAFYAISPHLVAANLYVLTESLTATLIVVLMGALALALRTGRWQWWLAAGLVLGYATLTRSYLTYFPLFLAPFLLAQYGMRYWRAVLALLFGFALLVAPWKAVVHQGGGADAQVLMRATIHHGMYPDMMYDGRPETLAFPYRFDPRSETIARDLGTLLAEIGARAEEDPVTYLHWYLIGKPLTMWRWGLLQGIHDLYAYEVSYSPYDYLPHFRLTYLLSEWGHYVLLALGVAACIAVWLPPARRVFPGWRLAMLRILSLLLVYATLVHMVGAPFPRYQVPQKAPLFLMAAAMLLALARGRAGVAAATRDRPPS